MELDLLYTNTDCASDSLGHIFTVDCLIIQNCDFPGRSLHQNTTFEEPLHSYPSCLGEGISGSNSSHSAFSSGLSVQLLKEKSDEDNRSNHVNHLTAATSETPCGDNMDESEPTVSFSDKFVGENISLHKAGPTTDSCSKNRIPGSTIPPSFFQEDTNASSNELSSFPCSQIKTIEKEKYSSSSVCGPSHFDDGVVEKPNGRIQSCSSSSQSCISYRKESHERRRPGSSSNAHRFPSINARGETGKETVNSFWQRVQKKDAEECSYGQEISVSSSPQEDVLGDNCGTAKKNSVSWYPIYRIPDGNFRAAFLTYHSLGYFIKRNFESAPTGRMQIVSPVVGLQSYNSKGECWFQQSKCTKEQPSSLNPSEILKERLRTLEQTASVMARASFRRGGSKVANRQPDHEFFLSRRW